MYSSQAIHLSLFHTKPVLFFAGLCSAWKTGLGGLPSTRIGAVSPGAWLPAGTNGGSCRLYPLGGGGGEGHNETLFA